jgi:hypothetical protein
MRQRGSTSPDALGVARNLPAAVAAAAFHPPVTPARAVLDLQEDLEYGGIGLAGELALRRVAGGRRIEGIEPSAAVGGRLTEVLCPTLADCLPMPPLDLRPLDLDAAASRSALPAWW